MKKKNAFLCITNHPDQLFFYKNIALLRKVRHPAEEIILCRIMNPYDAKTDFTSYKDSFSHVIEFPRIYKKNPFTALKEILLFRKQLTLLKKLLTRYTLKGVWCVDSGWIGVNILLWAFRKTPILYRWVLIDTSHMGALYYDRRRSWFYRLYAFVSLCSTCFLQCLQYFLRASFSVVFFLFFVVE